MDYRTFFANATRLPAPFSYQSRLAEQVWPDLLDVPTGMGKTAAVTLAWLWKRGWCQGNRSEVTGTATPRRLVWCLPMRVLIEQTEENIRSWLDTLGILGQAGKGKVSVHALMGGADDTKWASYPEEDAILIGTQDLLLSRALMRGYGMSRYQWPVHFALLHNDCLWVFDEVQLMGAGLGTSAQLEAFRRSFPLSKNSRSLWVSATLNRSWLDTVDFKPHLGSLKTLSIDTSDQQQAGERLNSVKTVAKLPITLGKDASNKKSLDVYLQALCEEVLKAHAADSQTIVILNRVNRAQGLFRLLRKARPEKTDVLIHSRFRAAERRKKNQLLRDANSADRIVVATQAVEAGLDISSRVLITEVAPWSSLVQRFGRCNRYGEHNADGAKILWIDIDDDKEVLKPYDSSQVAIARSHMANLASASPQDLPATCEARPLTAILRRKDLLDLFNTDPDLSGFDVDVSDYIRDSGQPGAQVFWRDFDDVPNQPQPQGGPVRDELCPISLGQAKDLFKRGAWLWDTLDDRWVRLDRPPRPGMMLLLKASGGGYDGEIGFDAGLKKPVQAIHDRKTVPDAFGDDPRSLQKPPIALTDHLGHAAGHIAQLCNALDETTHADVLLRAGLWHDVGKAHEVFQKTMHVCDKAPEGFLAKSPCSGKHSRKYFRHELASALAWLAQHNGERDADLIAYLVAAHHGKVRMSLRAMPTEKPAPDGKRFARGVWEGDELPSLDFQGERSNKTILSLVLMELGESEQGPSWTARTLNLLEQHGPFQLAWLETLVRLADWRASGEEQSAEVQERA